MTDQDSSWDRPGDRAAEPLPRHQHEEPKEPASEPSPFADARTGEAPTTSYPTGSFQSGGYPAGGGYSTGGYGYYQPGGPTPPNAPYSGGPAWQQPPRHPYRMPSRIM